MDKLVIAGSALFVGFLGGAIVTQQIISARFKTVGPLLANAIVDVSARLRDDEDFSYEDAKKQIMDELNFIKIVMK